MRQSSKAVDGMIWTLIERLSMQLCQFIIGIILARLLTPDDYGVIGMLAIFMAIAQSLLDGGFNRALIQKKERDAVDYSTVFYFNLVISVFIFILFFFSAPFIARFYNTPVLTDVTRVMALVVIFNGLSLVQTSKLTIELEFRIQTIISIVSIIISGIIGVIMAYNSMGVWALVGQSISGSIIRTVLLWIFTRWRPLAVFSIDSFRTLFSFGSKLLLGDFIHNIYTNMYTIVIGKAFNAADVGYYNRANGFAYLPSGIFGQVVNRVMFPILSESQDDNNSLLNKYSNLLRVPMFLYIPLMVALAALSRPIILVLIGDSWIDCISLMQILCIGYIFSPLTILNLNLLYVKGRSDISLKLDLIKKPIGVALLFASVPLGLWWMCLGKAIYDFIAFVMNCYYTKRILNYGFFDQFKDLRMFFFYSLIMYFVILIIISLFESIWLQLVIGLLSGGVTYLLISYIFKEPVLEEIVAFCKTRLGR